MEENNNNGNQVKEFIKDESKKLAKKAVKPLMKYIYIGIAFLLGILLALGLLVVVQAVIQDLFNSILSVFKPANADNATLSKSATESVIYIDEDGYYRLKAEDLSKQILEELEEQQVSPEAMDFITPNFEDMIEKYVKTEVKTMFPKIGQSDIDGMIIVKRASADENGTSDQKLEYVEYNEFYGMANDAEILNKFSINPNNFKLCIARKGGSTKYYKGDNVVKTTDSESTYVIEEKEYQTLIQRYAVPFNFLLTMHLISQDEDFMNDLIKLVVKEEIDEPIVLTYVESRLEEKVIYEYSTEVTESTKILDNSEYDENKIVTETEGSIADIVEGTVESTDMNNKYVSKYMNNVEFDKVIKKTYSGSLVVTKVDTWIRSSNITINPVSTNSGPDVGEKELVDKGKYNQQYKITDSESNDTVIKGVTTEYKLYVTQIQTTKGKRYTLVDEDSDIDVEKLVELIESYPSVENNIITSPSLIFYYLQQNENTQQHEKLMRYVISELDGLDYGVSYTELQYLFSSPTEYKSSADLLRDYIRHWEYTSKPPTNADETCYIVENSIDGQTMVGYGICIQESGYEYLFAENGYSTNVGAEIPIEFVDTIEENMINDRLEEIKAFMDGLSLTGYQINALVSRSYDCGVGSLEGSDNEAGAIGIRNGKNFIEAFEVYWDEEIDSTYFKDKNNEADMQHLLYTNYMSLPNSFGTSIRRQSEWRLFQTGYYDVLFKWHPGADSILEACVIVMNELIESNMKYSLSGLPNIIDFDKSKWNNPWKCCCATYVSRVLYVSGIVPAEIINAAGGTLNSSGGGCSGGVENILHNAGWTNVSVEEVQPGDVCIWHQKSGSGSGHVFIYAGDGLIWDETSGVYYGENHKFKPYGGPVPGMWNRWIKEHKICVLRMP